MQLAAKKELSQPIDEGYHPVDDIGLMESWAFGNISDAKRGEIIKHLASCVYCRRETSAMVRDGVLDFGDAVTNQPMVATEWGYSRAMKFLLTVAVVFMVALIGFWVMNTPQGEIARVTPEFYIARLNEFEMTKGGGQTEEKKTIEEIKTEAGNDPKQLFEAGLQLLEMGHEDAVTEAIAIFEQLNREYPDCVALLNALGVAHYVEGNKVEAIKYFEKAIQLDPENSRIRENLDTML